MLDRLPETSPTPPANVDEESSGDECVDHRFECKLTSQTSHPSPLTLRLEKVVMQSNWSVGIDVSKETVMVACHEAKGAAVCASQ